MSCEKSEALLLETVWLSQTETEKAEAEFQKLSLQDVQIDIIDSGNEKDNAFLKEETVWFKQSYYEAAEAHYQMYLAGTLNSAAATTHPPGTPNKRLHKQEQKKQSKKQRQESDVKCEAFEKKLRNNVTILSKTVKNIHDRLQDFEKIQQRKAQAIRDTVTRLTSALEACQSQLEEDLVKTTTQLSSFNVVLGDIDSLVSKTNQMLEEESWGDFGNRKSFCQSMGDRISNLNGEMVHCSDIIHCFQPDVSKSDINKIVGDISKISLIKKYSGLDRYISKKDAITKNIKEIFEPAPIKPGEHTSSDGSLQGSGSVSDNSENESGTKAVKTSKLKAQQKHKENKFRNGKANSNNSLSHSNNKSSAGANQAGRMKMEASPFQNTSATPKKRNAQGAPNSLQKKQEPFKFRGVSLSSKNPFMHQPGLLGPRPNLMQSANQQTPFRFSNMNNMVQQSHQPPLQNFGGFQNVNPVSSGNQSAFGNLNFNFANQPCSNNSLLPNPSVNFNSSQGQVNAQGIPNTSSHARNSKLFPQNQSHGKFMKGPEQYGAQSRNAGFSFPFQRGQMGTGLLHNAQGSLMNTFTGTPQGSMEQQLNEMSQKIQQMQLAASQNYQLQRLMQETERLKQMVSQKQHQQHDRFQHQFQLLINAFMQQQQQQLTQGPQSKMAKSVMYQNSQRQRLIQNRQHQLQQQKKHKQQQNKVQQVKQEQSNNPLKKLKPETALNPVQSSNSAVNAGTKQAIHFPSKNCLITKINHFDPQSPGDKHRAGISSMVVLDNLSCLVILDIINGCLKMYEVARTQDTTGGKSHNFVTRLELPRPFYMSKLKEDILVISREGKKLSLVRVSKKRLEFLRDVITDAQYYGVAYVRENLIACAAYTDNRIDLVNIQDNMVQVSSLTERRRGPELVCGMDRSGSILYLERESEVAVRLVCVSQKNAEEFVVELNSRDSDVWNFTAIEDVIVCGNKQSNELKLFSNTGGFLAELKFPVGSINHPFAMAFCHNGNLYIANDGDWDGEYGHYITTEINLYQFS